MTVTRDNHRYMAVSHTVSHGPPSRPLPSRPVSYHSSSEQHQDLRNARHPFGIVGVLR